MGKGAIMEAREKIHMKLSEFFEKAKTKDIVINTDIDGFLCGMILQKYYDCRVVGFSNSDDAIWLIPEIESIYKPVYIDIFVNKPEVFCIDQHIVAYDKSYLKRIVAWGSKMNPNLDLIEKTYTDDYYHKYPFGTVHYLIALMKLDGIDVAFNDLKKGYIVKGIDKKKYDITPGQVILRADDALYSSLGPYAENAKNWWSQLKTFQSKTIDDLYDYLYSTCKQSKNREYKDHIGQMFKRGLGCDGIDGAFDQVTDRQGKLLKRVADYNNIINTIIGIQMDLPQELKLYKGKPDRSAWSEEKQKKAVTYAFVLGPTKADKSFSFTIDIH